jgi:hypothetical protein
MCLYRQSQKVTPFQKDDFLEIVFFCSCMEKTFFLQNVFMLDLELFRGKCIWLVETGFISSL